MMTTELNSPQRISYYTGVRLIRQHQSGNAGNLSRSSYHSFPFPSQHPIPTRQQPALHHHGQQYMANPKRRLHLHDSSQSALPGLQISPYSQPPPPLNIFQQCPDQRQSKGCVGTASYTTSLYTGSPLIRCNAYSASGENAKKQTHKRSNICPNYSSGSLHKLCNASSSYGSNIQNPHQCNGGEWSCSSGTSSSSSSNEHLNILELQQKLTLPPARPTQPTEALDAFPSKPSKSRSASPRVQNESILGSLPRVMDSSGFNSSPTPFICLPSSQKSTDNNKNLDHFYFLDEHWKPSRDAMDGGTIRLNTGRTDVNTCTSSSKWNSITPSGSISSPPPSSNKSPELPIVPMMVDQLPIQSNNNILEHGELDFDGESYDLNNNSLKEVAQTNHHNFFRNGSFRGFIGNSASSHPGSIASKNGNSSVVNVETQIGTFNGQRDLEIRLSFMTGGDRVSVSTVHKVLPAAKRRPAST